MIEISGIINSYPIRLEAEDSVSDDEYCSFSPNPDVSPTSLLDDDVHPSAFHVKSDGLYNLVENLSGEGRIIVEKYPRDEDIIPRTEAATLNLSDEAVRKPLDWLDSSLQDHGYDTSYLVCTELRVGMNPDLQSLDRNLSQLNVNIGIPQADIVRLEYDPQREKVYAFSEYQRDIVTGESESVLEEEERNSLEQSVKEAGLDVSFLEHSTGHRLDRMLEDSGGSLSEEDRNLAF